LIRSGDCSILAAIFDEEALLAVGVYIDLNPVATTVAGVPDASEYKSIKRRVNHIKADDETAELDAAKDGSVAGSRGRRPGGRLAAVPDRGPTPN
jgi:hypothetical protein